MPDVQKAIQAMLQALDTPEPTVVETAAKRVVCISRDYGTGGDTIAGLLAQRLGVEVYDRQILERIATRLNADRATLQAVNASSSQLRDLWLYSLVTGKDLSEDTYKHHLINVVVSIARSGGVIVGGGAHLILARSGALRVRFTGSPEICAARVAAAENLDLDTALKRVEEANHSRGKLVWDHFQVRLNDPRTFDLVINTDRITDHEKVVDMLTATIDMLAQPPQ
jgi:cytidylate kinase